MILIFLRKCRLIVELGNLKDVLKIVQDNGDDDFFVWFGRFCGHGSLIGSMGEILSELATLNMPTNLRDFLFFLLYFLFSFRYILSRNLVLQSRLRNQELTTQNRKKCTKV